MRKIIFIVAYVVAVLLLFELGVRLTGRAASGSFLDSPNRIHYSWYPELRRIEEAGERDAFDVLLLGGSVCARLARTLRPALREVSPDIRIFNGARSAHTSRDSLNKYRYLARRSFDLVIFYHGINELRMNNSPPEMFRDDYTHLAWYRYLDAYESGRPRTFALPFTLRLAGLAVGAETGILRFQPRESPRSEWTRYGNEVRSAESLGANLQALAALAREKGEPLVVPSFVTHFPGNYTPERFRKGQLGFAEGGLATEIWGRPEHVEHGVAVHNEVLRDVAAREGLIHLDIRGNVPDDPAMFTDVCHFSDEGQDRFVEALIAELQARDLLP